MTTLLDLILKRAQNDPNDPLPKTVLLYEENGQVIRDEQGVPDDPKDYRVIYCYEHPTEPIYVVEGPSGNLDRTFPGTAIADLTHLHQRSDPTLCCADCGEELPLLDAINDPKEIDDWDEASAQHHDGCEWVSRNRPSEVES